MEKLLSVIIPVYNVEEYLDKCLDSVCNQTYKNLQIIIVNDGSTDNSLSICKKWAEKDNRILLLSKNNEGVSVARNFALNYIKGNYLAFMDSDDYIEPNMYETMLNSIEKSGSQICVCATNVINNEKLRWISSLVDIDISTAEEALVFLFSNKISSALWNKIYETKLFENITFPEGKINEDTMMVPVIFSKANKISYINKPMYNYIERQGSYMRQKPGKYLFDRIDASEFLYTNYKNISKDAEIILSGNLYSTAKDVFELIYSLNDDKMLREAFANLKKATKIYWHFADFKEKLSMLRVFLGYKFYCFYYKMKTK